MRALYAPSPRKERYIVLGGGLDRTKDGQSDCILLAMA